MEKMLNVAMKKIANNVEQKLPEGEVRNVFHKLWPLIAFSVIVSAVSMIPGIGVLVIKGLLVVADFALRVGILVGLVFLARKTIKKGVSFCRECADEAKRE